MSSSSGAVADVLVVGGGPAGAVCAAFCARAGLRVTLLERTTFPRDKVCGDCLNPRAWPTLERLGLAPRVLHLPHARLGRVDFVDARGRTLTCPLPPTGPGEIAVRRRDLDGLLLSHARECGARVLEAAPVTTVHRPPVGTPGGAPWQIEAAGQLHRAHTLVAADGRNSTVARLLGLLPPTQRDRVGLQTHLPLPPGAGEAVIMRFLPAGYCGLADIGGGMANLCLVSCPARLAEVKAWAITHFALPPAQAWRSITPLERLPIAPHAPGLLLVGDVARVVEPFTGEGISHALATGELAAHHLIHGTTARYAAAHRALYRGRLWVNALSRLACKHPAFASTFLRTAHAYPPLLTLLTRKVVGA